eukprot:CAMPEP_0206234824 /NCGR_PEP_ID=MMETSP0047_2-20121206/12800_1 /ASSEMBLY_ACC=CAM_ASM_000192 /TAXON_ID=195065 /ORGANISM="Chroomonas mesostigmatica_cf, Strain CCMP1168" /LENGTH=289 /DNA_ID=CAMNT_0053658943 /DNA_START=101 /DNA_END=970 /DNA_ORIENTATION=+
MLRVAVFSACLCAASAFAPVVPGVACSQLAARSPLAQQHAGSSRRMGAAPLRMGFSFGKKKEEPKKNPWGNQNPYRIFGVTETAPYEEVEAAFKALVEENEGNEKYIMQLEMMKEKIFDDRLYARMSGALKSKVANSPFEAKLIVKKDPWWSKIAWLKKIVQLPDKKYGMQVSALMACFVFAGLAAPQLASTTMGFGFLSSMGFLYNRGTPEIARDDAGNPGESRPANYPALVKTIALCGIWGGLGFALAQVVISSAAIPASMPPDAVINTFFNFGLWFAALFFQVQDE